MDKHLGWNHREAEIANCPADCTASRSVSFVKAMPRARARTSKTSGIALVETSSVTAERHNASCQISASAWDMVAPLMMVADALRCSPIAT